MALVKCKECGKEVSKSAKKCPHCGYKLKMSFLAKFGLFIFGFVIFGAFVSGLKWNPEKSRIDPVLTEKKASEKKIEDEALQRKILAERFTDAIRKKMRDPNSFEVELIKVNKDATVFCLAYRARNGFGGMNREIAIYKNDKVFRDSDTWNKNCTSNMFDETR
jgi:hypothetical protein